MHIPTTFRTSYGPAGFMVRPMHRLSLTTAEVHTLARAIDRDAASAEQEGRDDVATSLAWRAAAIREAAR